MKSLSRYPRLRELSGDITRIFGSRPVLRDEYGDELPPAETKRIFSSQYDQLHCSDYRLLLAEGNFAQQVYFVPAAIAVMRDRLEARLDVCWTLFLFLERLGRDELVKAGLLQRILSELETTFWGWVAAYSCRPVTGILVKGLVIPPCVEAGDERDTFLDCLCEFAVMSHGELMAQSILRKMAGDESKAPWAAHLLDVLLWSEFYRSMEKDNVFQKIANDHSRVLKTWSIAHPLIESQCPMEYVSVLRQILRIPD